MNYIDTWGWYTHEVLPGRATDIEPPSTSMTTTPGQPRANWNGRGWDMRPYVAPPVEPPPTAPVPVSVTRAQGKAALIGAQLWSAVLAFVAEIEDNTQRALAEVALHDTLEWRRDSPFLAAAAQALGMSPADLDALFITASEIHL